MPEKKSNFINGYLCCAQFIAISHDQPSLASDALKESGYSERDFVTSQVMSGYENTKMFKVIKEAFKKKGE